MKKKFERILCFITTVVIAAGLFLIPFTPTDSYAFSKAQANSVASSASLGKMKAKAYASMYFDSGKVSFSSDNCHDRFSVGNLIKLMTLYLAFEAVSNGKTSLKSGVKVSRAAQNISVGRERVFLDSGKGEVITVEEAIIAIIAGSANDAAYALAEHLSGSNEAAFVEKMNEKAAALGLNDTHYVDSTGIKIITDGQYTSAYDLCMLSYRIIKDFPAVLNYSRITSGTFVHSSTGQPDTNMQSSNALVYSGMLEGADGLLVGYSTADLYAQAASALIDGERTVAVVIGEKTPEDRAGELKFLLDMTSKVFEWKELDKEGTYVRMISVKDGKSLKVKTVTGQSIDYIANTNEKYTVEKKIVLDGVIEAPVSKGDIAGKVVYQKAFAQSDGTKRYEEIGSVDLIIDEDMDRANWFVRFLRKILEFLGLMQY
ncbi:MAG: D-alanyl-D-alanine carboxypeptidase [Clostridia bacterium]|nr:D-alanyl-D-alanine carboxypeptidase [Clostridia bacterium]